MRPVAPPITFCACRDSIYSFLPLFSPHLELWVLPPTTVVVAYLPPVGVLLVHHLQDVSLGEVQASIFTGDQAVGSWIIIEVWLQVNLRVAIEKKTTRGMKNNVKDFLFFLRKEQ